MKKKVLYVVHNIVSNPPFGGLEIHQDTLAKNIAEEYEVYFLYSVENPEKKGRIFIFSDSEYNKIDSCVGQRNNYADYLTDRQVEKWFAQVLYRNSIDLVHFFHFINNIPSLTFISKAMGVPYVVSIHDFYVVCRYFTLMDHRDKYCDIGLSVNQCDTCLNKRAGLPIGSQSSRRDFYRKVLEEAHSIIYMSNSTKQKVEDVYPSLVNHPYPRIHGAPLPKSKAEEYRILSENRIQNDLLHVVVPGNMALHKGGVYLVEAIKQLRNREICFHFWGGLDKNIEKMLREVAKDRVVFHGRYDIGGLPYFKYDVSLHLSVWPETYCQTLSEAWAARAVPICTNIGAFNDRVTHGVNGFLVDYQKPESLTFILDDLAINRKKIARVKAMIDDSLFLNQTQHANMYKEVYSQLVTDCKPIGFYNFNTKRDLGLYELHFYTRRTTWHHVGIKHPEDTLIIPDID
ncbi:glycosyltransferase [Actinobacillus porcinus]|uniref:glycosyltransferase n=1 Tax=Actinobacillus porcinus TaxID=51048 RepID=UPI0023533F70|nr:glycosyltransferase [Actinobacillus porcinus]